MSKLRESLAKQSGHIISYMSGKQSVVEAVQRISEAKAERQSAEPEVFGIVCLLASYFKEDVNSLFILRDSTTAASEVDCLCLPPHPCIVVFGRYNVAMLTCMVFF
jgi:hypothetical protein